MRKPAFCICENKDADQLPVCVGPGRKSRRPVFSERGSIKIISSFELNRFDNVISKVS